MSDTTTTTDSAPRWLLSIPEACKGLGVGRSTFYGMVARGDVEVVRIGRRALGHRSVSASRVCRR